MVAYKPTKSHYRIVMLANKTKEKYMFFRKIKLFFSISRLLKKHSRKIKKGPRFDYAKLGKDIVKIMMSKV